MPPPPVIFAQTWQSPCVSSCVQGLTSIFSSVDRSESGQISFICRIWDDSLKRAVAESAGCSFWLCVCVCVVYVPVFLPPSWMKARCCLLPAFQGRVTQTLFRCEWCFGWIQSRGGGCCYPLLFHIMRCVCVCVGLVTLVLSGAPWWMRLLECRCETWLWISLPPPKCTQTHREMCTSSLKYHLQPALQPLLFFFHLFPVVTHRGYHVKVFRLLLKQCFFTTFHFLTFCWVLAYFLFLKNFI